MGANARVGPLTGDGDSDLITKVQVESIHHAQQKVKVKATNDPSTITTPYQSVTKDEMDISEC